jgi:hypothetical protein
MCYWCARVCATRPPRIGKPAGTKEKLKERRKRWAKDGPMGKRRTEGRGVGWRWGLGPIFFFCLVPNFAPTHVREQIARSQQFLFFKKIPKKVHHLGYSKKVRIPQIVSSVVNAVDTFFNWMPNIDPRFHQRSKFFIGGIKFFFGY